MSKARINRFWLYCICFSFLALPACTKQPDKAPFVTSSAPYEIDKKNVAANGQWFETVNGVSLLRLPGLDGKAIGDGLLPVYTRSEIDDIHMKGLTELPPLASPPAVYTKQEWTAEQTGISKPLGILARESDLVVVDYDACCLVVLNYLGNAIKTIGAVGNGELEFLNPTGITEHNGDIYVLDDGNDRIQILTSDFRYKASKQLIRPTSSSDINFTDVAIDAQGNIYLSRMDTSPARMYCYPNELAPGLMPSVIAENFAGFLCEKDGQVYAINYGSYYEQADKKSKEISTGITSGNNALFLADAKQLHKIIDLPPCFSPLDFIINSQDNIICIGETRAQLAAFSKDCKSMSVLKSFYELTADPEMSVEIGQLGPYAYLEADINDNYYATTPNLAQSQIVCFEKQ